MYTTDGQVFSAYKVFSAFNIPDLEYLGMVGFWQYQQHFIHLVIEGLTYLFFFGLLCISWNIGPAHIISISTEVYFDYQYGIEQIVQQYEWLERDLQVSFLGVLLN